MAAHPPEPEETGSLMRRFTVTALGVVALALSACAADDDAPLEIDEPTADEPADQDDAVDDDASDDDAAAEEEDVDRDELPERLEPDDANGRAAPGGVASDLEDEVESAVADLASRTGADPTDIEVVVAEHVTWPDGSIGCPEPDQMYTMALVEGYRIVLEHDGEQVHYHGQDGSEPFHCANPSAPTDDGRPTS